MEVSGDSVPLPCWGDIPEDISQTHHAPSSPGEGPGQDVRSSVGCQQSAGGKPPLSSDHLSLNPFLLQNKVVTVDGVRVKLQVRPETRWQVAGGGICPFSSPQPTGGLWPCPHPGLTSCGHIRGNNNFCLFDVCRERSSQAPSLLPKAARSACRQTVSLALLPCFPGLICSRRLDSPTPGLGRR